MASDRETLREVWEGRIPVCLTLSADEIESETPEPVFVSWLDNSLENYVVKTYHNFPVLG